MYSNTPNHLIQEKSPYLLQHAYNPVEWFPWGKEALEKAKSEKKPILVSIGYSSCHWCHVMEHESFNKTEVSDVMNDLFINIKVDREERPDIDQIYMDAIQAMGTQGGWPLNVFLTSEGKPFYGGTYFPKDKWINLLKQVSLAYNQQFDKVNASATDLTKHLNQSDLAKFGLKQSDLKPEALDYMYGKLRSKLDKQWGGTAGAPKFPMPCLWNFIGNFYAYSKSEEALNALTFTLDQMASGGIYDQIKGGFSRYSVDERWFAPHFEKMAYDNGQLLSLYAKAYKITKKERYIEVIEQTINWLQEEMTSTEGGFYSALDADSEGEEGKFYIWTYSELKTLNLPEFELFEEYFFTSEEGNWEKDYNILTSPIDLDYWIEKLGKEKLQHLKSNWLAILNKARDKRIRPGLDNKIILGWNALLISGLTDAYTALGKQDHLNLALKAAHFIEDKLSVLKSYYHNYLEGPSVHKAYLDDLALLIESYLKLYQATLDNQWLLKAKSIMDECINNFYDQEEGFFYFTETEAEALIARKKELFDNVIPASNSVLANNLYILGHYFPQTEYAELAKNMLSTLASLAEKEPGFMSNWGSLYYLMTSTTTEVVVSGEKALENALRLQSNFIPNSLFAHEKDGKIVAWAENKKAPNGASEIFICYNYSCKQPVTSVEEALKQLP